MEGLRQAASFCSALPSCRRSSSTSCMPSARHLCLSSAQYPSAEFMHMEICKHDMYTRAKSKGLLAGRLTLRATATPANEDQQASTETVQAVNEDQGASTETVQAAINNISLDVPRWMGAFYRFSRPYSIIGTAVCITSFSLLAVQSIQDFSLRFAVGLGQALIPALCMQLYMVGVNQIFDIEIDKINKPYLPLASGDFSVTTGIFIVTLSAFLSFAMGAYIGSRPLLWGLSLTFLFANAYSVELPWLRWKRSAFGTAFTIVTYRGIVMQLAYYMHMQCFVFERAAVLSKPLIYAIGIMCCFLLVIAIFKDIPDLEGDRAFGMQSLPVRLGQKRVFWLCIYLLLAAYGSAALIGVTCKMIWTRMAMVLGHAILAGILCYRASQIDLKSKAAFADFYLFIWKLFYAEYFLIPFMR